MNIRKRICFLGLTGVLLLQCSGCGDRLTNDTSEHMANKRTSSLSDITQNVSVDSDIDDLTTEPSVEKEPAKTPYDNQEGNDFFTYLSSKGYNRETLESMPAITKNTVYEYNEQGTLIRKTNPSTNTTWEYEYNDSKTVITETCYDYGTVRCITVREYDQYYNEICEKVSVQGDPFEVRNSYTYEYDENGCILSKTWMQYEGFDTPIIRNYVYDGAGHLLTVSFDEETYPNETYEYYYDDDGNVIHALYYKGGFTYYATDDYVYSEDGKLLSSTGRDSKQVYKFRTYDSFGNTLEDIKYAGEDYSVITQWNHYEYNEAGKIVAEYKFNSTPSTYDVVTYSLTVILHEYDLNNNEIKTSYRYIQ